MDAIESKDEETLRLELRAAREGLDALVRDLRSVDAELSGLDIEKNQHRLLEEVCGRLDELKELGGSELFWSGEDGLPDGDAHLRMVRSRVDSFEKRFGEIERRRLEIIDELDRQGETTDFLAGEILEVERLEELKKLEWLIEREDEEVPFTPLVMPWIRGGEDDRRFRKSLSVSLLVALLFGLILPLIDLPIPDRSEVAELPERYTRLVREEPPPATVTPPPKPIQTETVAPNEEVAEVAEPTPQEVAPKPKPGKGTGSKGVLAFRENFSGLARPKATDRLGSNARISNAGETASGAPERSLLTTQAAGSSGGINVAALSRDVGGGGDRGFEGVQVVQATSSIGTGGGSDRPLSGGPSAGRTDEEIQIVFDRHKSALYRLYNRELRNNPTLRGQMILRMTIEPDGSVSLCELKSTDLKSATLSAQVIARVKTFDFGAKEGISALSILYPIDFLPAT